MINHIYA